MTDATNSNDAPSVALGRPGLDGSSRASRRKELTIDDKAELLAWLASGQSLPAFLRLNPAFPSTLTIARVRDNDPEFGKAYELARSAGLELALDEATDYANACRGDKALAIAAGRYAETIGRVAEKLAPKQYGPMIKHAGHDGNALSVSVVRFDDVPSVTENGGKLIEVDPE